jgi:hypothetical protein
MTWPMPPPWQRPGNHHRIVHGMGDDSLCPHAYPHCSNVLPRLDDLLLKYSRPENHLIRFWVIG